MKIDRLVLENFRGLAHVALTFAPSVNLIVGINGAGKTSILDALKIVLAKSMPELIDRPLSFPGIGLVESDITLGRNAASITCQMTRLGQSFELAITEQRSEIRDALLLDKFNALGTKAIDSSTAKGSPRRLLAGDPRLEGTLRGQTSAGTQGSNGLIPTPNTETRQARPLPLVLYLSVRRAIVSNAISTVGTRQIGYQRAFAEDRGLNARQLAEWWRGREALAGEEPLSRAARQLSVVQEALVALLPHLSDWRIESNELSVTKLVRINRIDSEGNDIQETELRRIPLKMLSDGERSLAAIGADIAQRLVILNETSNDPLGEGVGVVLIDELDLHLHPQWQRRVIGDLRRTFPMLQFICTTHSPQLIGQVKPEEIIHLGSPSIRTGQSYGMDSNWILRHVMDSDDRDPVISERLDALFEDIESADFESAQTKLCALREELGEHPDLVEAEALIGHYTRFNTPGAE